MKILEPKSKEELEKLPTPRLLALYKVERRKFKLFNYNCICECCGEYMWDIKSIDYSKNKEELSKRSAYVTLIKDLLSLRENVE